MAKNSLPISMGIGVLLCGLQTIAVSAEVEPMLKARGIGLSVYSQQQDV